MACFYQRVASVISAQVAALARFIKIGDYRLNEGLNRRVGGSFYRALQDTYSRSRCVLFHRQLFSLGHPMDLHYRSRSEAIL